MKTYRVRWEIDVEAGSQSDAVRQALEIQHELGSAAAALTVDGQRIDLNYRCNLCRDQFTLQELRQLLRAHSPAADSAIDANDVGRFFTLIH